VNIKRTKLLIQFPLSQVLVQVLQSWIENTLSSGRRLTSPEQTSGLLVLSKH